MLLVSYYASFFTEILFTRVLFHWKILFIYLFLFTTEDKDKINLFSTHVTCTRHELEFHKLHFSLYQSVLQIVNNYMKDEMSDISPFCSGILQEHNLYKATFIAFLARETSYEINDSRLDKSV